MGAMGELLINEGGVDPSVNYTYIYVCVCVCVYGHIKVWVSGKMQ